MGIDLTIWALAGVILFIAVGIFSAELDSAWLSTATFIIGIVVLNFGFGIQIISAMLASPIVAAAVVIGYIAIGALITSVWSWPDYIRQQGSEINDSYAKWASKQKTVDDNSFDAYLDSDEYEFNAGDHKERLATFVGMWPFKMIWDLSRRPAIWLFNTSWSGLGTLFQNIGKRTARNVHSKKN